MCERYARELVALCDVADAIADGLLPALAVREVADRMLMDSPASLTDGFEKEKENVYELRR